MSYETYRVADLIDEIAMGPFGSNIKVSCFVDSGVPVLNGSNLEGFSLSEKAFRYVTEEKADSLNKANAHRGDIVITHRGTLGQIVFIPQDSRYDRYVISQSQFRVRCNDKVLPEYLVYYFHTPIGQYKLLSNASQVGVPALARPSSTFQQIEVTLPELSIQKRVVEIITTIQRKIENNQELNDNLEQQAAALFSSLYNRSNTEVRYTDLIQILGGGTPKTGETAYWNGNIAFFTPKDVGTPYTFITEKTITEEGLSHCNSRLYPVNTVFVTARGTVGKVGLSGIPMAMNQSCYALVGKETHQLLVYFYTLKAVDRLKHKASGAVFDAITTRDFDSEQIMKLSDDDAKAFLCVAEPMFQEMLNNSIENLRLSTLRDFLLPKLMSGEIDVSSVQL
ncbi:restriction endonuclease subunit S [Faecalibacterium prausnitzii]|jgi:type I restriction enzyme S subunit|uniref:Type I restriction modification DNA specificity domain protein n=1 Tax=Faecalibacterium prausnitzii M21/2 TaxID=411485 RepID=A8SGM7_9FIRM|nr:restriction endonuclease subunit S [Faecalibacterium prausnitzii]EDP20315.1 type I restriction modification DNA specificity domain protein [Faecalibacterium prausnitzii M21/2]